MAELKTKATGASVEDFINKVPSEEKRKDSFELIAMMQKATGEKAVMWGPSIVGFGQYHYKYDSGHEGDICMVGFSPRKQALTLYLLSGANKRYENLLSKLGKYKTSKACLYIKRLADVDKKVLEDLIKITFSTLQVSHK